MDVIFKLRPKKGRSGLCRTLWHMKDGVVVEQKDQVELLSRELWLECLEMRARGRCGPDLWTFTSHG